MKLNGRLIIFTIILVIIATACKFFFGPDLAMSGFSPVIAIALFAGFIIKDRDASFMLPLVALFISDLVIQLLYTQNLFPYEGIYDGQWKNYLLLLSCTAIGWLLKGKSIRAIGVGALIAPTVYFLLSNFLVWKATSEVVYAKSFSGLMTCYGAALPFYRNSLIATLVFLPIILVSYNMVTKKETRLVVA